MLLVVRMCLSVSFVLPSIKFIFKSINSARKKRSHPYRQICGLVECFIFFICLIFTLFIFPSASVDKRTKMHFFCNQNIKSLSFHSYNFQSIVKSILLLFVEEEHWSFRVFLCVYNNLSDSHNSNWCKMKSLCHSFEFKLFFFLFYPVKRKTRTCPQSIAYFHVSPMEIFEVFERKIKWREDCRIFEHSARTSLYN